MLVKPTINEKAIDPEGLSILAQRLSKISRSTTYRIYFRLLRARMAYLDKQNLLWVAG